MNGHQVIRDWVTSSTGMLREADTTDADPGHTVPGPDRVE